LKNNWKIETETGKNEEEKEMGNEDRDRSK
jgi:hypothetical protein